MGRETMDQFISGLMVGVLVVFLGVVILYVFTNLKTVEDRSARPLLINSSPMHHLGKRLQSPESNTGFIDSKAEVSLQRRLL